MAPHNSRGLPMKWIQKLISSVKGDAEAESDATPEDRLECIINRHFRAVSKLESDPEAAPEWSKDDLLALTALAEKTDPEVKASLSTAINYMRRILASHGSTFRSGSDEWKQFRSDVADACKTLEDLSNTLSMRREKSSKQ